MKNIDFLTKVSGAVVLMLMAFAVPSTFSQTSGSPRQEKLLNGLKVLMFSDPKSDRVDLKIRVHAGSAFDPQGKEGVMKLLAANVFSSPDAKLFFKEDLGGDLEIVSNYDYIQINASAKPDELLSLLETVATAITNIVIDKDTTAKLKAAQMKQLQELEADPAYVADQAVTKRLFGTFPYGRPQVGTAASLQKIDFADLLEAKQRFFTSDNATLAISGKIDSNLVFRAIRRNFGAWLKADKLVPSTFRQPDEPPVGTEMLASPAGGRYEIRYAFRGTARGSKDFVAAEILASVLESRLKTLVAAEYRDRVSLTHDGHILPGVFLVRIGGTNAATPANMKGNDPVSKALSTAVSEAEFQLARTAFLTKWNLISPEDHWLDLDTFRIDSVANDRGRASSAKLADVQEMLNRIQKQPIAGIVMAPTGAVN